MSDHKHIFTTAGGYDDSTCDICGIGIHEANTPTAPDNKPSNLRDALSTYFVEYKAARTPHEMQQAEDEAVAAITGLLPEKLAEITADDMPLSKAKREGWNNYADTTLRNFSGQTDGEGE